jgi:hypothetical protein
MTQTGNDVRNPPESIRALVRDQDAQSLGQTGRPIGSTMPATA